MSSSAAELKVKKLARLASNTVCANCGTTKKFGFSTVCIKYYTFVCNNCKSSHQAISHRCKSLTMSSWTDQEAAELQNKGNDYARRTWLKNAPPVGQGGRPREGDPVDVFKRFVVDVYERKRYYGEDVGSSPAPVATPVAAPVAAPVPTQRPRAPAPVAAPPMGDLLDFSAAPASKNNEGSATFEANFDAFAPKATPAPPPTTNSNPSFVANFDAFAPKPTSTAPQRALSMAPQSAPSNDPFQPSATSATSGFSFMNASTPTVAVKKPVMNNHSMNEKSSLISSMNMASGPTHPPQGNNAMGWNNTGNHQGGSFGGMGNMQQQQMNMMMMMQQQQMNAMNGMMNMGSGMMNNNNGMMMMMGNGMMNQQQTQGGMMMRGNNFGNGVVNGKSKNAMDSLQMNSTSMNAWSSGFK